MIALFAIYLLVRYFFTDQLDGLGLYSSYLFEIVVVVIAYFLTGKKINKKYKFNSKIFALLAGALVFGFVVFKLSIVVDVVVPFHLEAWEPVIFLLLIAPLLEEAIFRFFSWQVFAQISQRTAWIATSLLFSLAHFHGIFSASTDYYPFLYYQTIYTFLLGLGCGYFVYRYQSLMGAVLIHFSFNLGFYLASLF